MQAIRFKWLPARGEIQSVDHGPKALREVSSLRREVRVAPDDELPEPAALR
jgi:hypothetical protein